MTRKAVPLLDIVYWSVATVMVFYVLYHSNYGQVRIYVFIGLCLGTAIYFTLISSTMVRIIKTVIEGIKKLIRLLLRLFDLLIVTPILLLYKLTIILLGFLTAISIFLYKFMLQLLYPLWRFILFIFRPLIRLVKRIPVPRWIPLMIGKIKQVFKRLF
jgi:spore cortex biosynthesis protein YabQ